MKKYKVIDTHVHARDLDQANVSTIEETIRLARLWWVWTLCFMPNTTPAIVNIEILEKYISLIEKADLWRHYIYFGLTENNLEECEEALKREEVVWLKVYPLWVTTGEGSLKAWISDHRVLDEAIPLVIKYDKVISFHWESADMVAERWHIPEAEIDYFENIIAKYALLYPEAKIIAAHASLKESIKPLIEARKKWANISIEFTPHHIWFTEDDAIWNPFLKCFPPLRSLYDRDFLRDMLKTDDIPIMFWSDHAPHLRTAKLGENPPGWVPNLWNAVSVFLKVCKDAWLSDEKIEDILYNNALKLLNIVPNEFEFTWEYSFKEDYYGWKVENPFKYADLD